MENSNSKKRKESQNPAVRTIASRNSNQPEIGINAAKETKTNAMETIAAMKSPFAPTISSADIQMPNVATLAIQGEQMPTIKITLAAMSGSNNRDRNHQQDRNYRNNQDNRNNQQCNHHYPTRSQQQREESHQQQEASDDRSQHTTNHSESDDEIFALEEKRNINNNDQNIITKQDYVPEIAIGVLADVVTKRYKYLRALIDSGSSSSIICESSMPDPIKKKIKDDPSGETKWTTKGGTYITTGEANIWFQLTEFAPSRLFKHKFKVDRDAKSASYDIILGRDAMKELQFDLLYSENIPKIRFEQEVEIDCKPRGFWSRSRLHQVYFQAQQSTIDKAEEEFLEKRRFSQAQYQAADLRKCLPNHLSSQEKEKLYALLDKHRFLFKGTLGLLPTKPVHVEIKSNAKPFHGRAFSVPKAYESMIRNEVERLCRLNVLRRCNESEWAAPSFGTPKKNGQIRFVSDFRQLNKWIIRRPYPMPCIHELFKRFEGFTYCTALDLNMGFWTIPLDNLRNAYANVGKFELGVSNFKTNLTMTRMTLGEASLRGSSICVKIYVPHDSAGDAWPARLW